MYKARFELWHMRKNLCETDWQAVAQLLKQARLDGQWISAFEIHGRTRTVADLQRNSKSQHPSLDERVARAEPGQVMIPDYIHPITSAVSHPASQAGSATGEDRPSSPKGRSSPTKHREQLLTTQSGISAVDDGCKSHTIISTPVSVDCSMESTQVDVRDLTPLSTSTDNSFMVVSHASSDGHDTVCDQKTKDFARTIYNVSVPRSHNDEVPEELANSWVLITNSNMSAQEASTRPEHVKETYLCRRCRQDLREHVFLPPRYLDTDARTLQPLVPVAQHASGMAITAEADDMLVYVTCCFSACVYMHRRELDQLAKSLHQADSAAERLFRSNNSLSLCAVATVLHVLHVQDQGRMTASIIRSALTVAKNTLGEHHCITNLIDWMTRIAGSLPQEPGDRDKLHDIWKQFRSDHGIRHPFTLVAMYSMCFCLTLLEDHEEATKYLEELYQLSTLTFGAGHLLSLQTLVQLSLNCSKTKKFALGIEYISKAIDGSRRLLGPEHPRTLENERQLAVLYQNEEVNRDEDVEPIYWRVFRGRVKMLGAEHSYSKASQQDLIEWLDYLNKWDADVKAEILKIVGGRNDPAPRLEAFLTGSS